MFPRLGVTFVLTVTLVAVAKADPSSPDISTVDKKTVDDPDGVPILVSHPQPVVPTASQLKAERKRKEAAEQNKDWLLKSYEEQLQKRSNDSQDNSDLYYKLASDKTLSKIAGLTFISPSTSQQDSVSKSTGNASGNKPSSSLGAPTKPSSSTGIGEFKPLITPLSAADAAGLHNFYSTIPAATAPAKASSTASSDAAQNAADLDMPGQLAARNDPFSGKGMRLTFDASADDALPDETPSSRNKNAPAPAALPSAITAVQPPKTQTSQALMLNTPGSGKTASNAPVVNAPPQQIKLSDDAPARIAPPSAVRQPIANPYSILDR